MSESPLKPFQQEAADAVYHAIKSDQKRIFLAISTGSGSNRIIATIVKRFIDNGFDICIITNRRAIADDFNRSIEDFLGRKYAVATPEHSYFIDSKVKILTQAKLLNFKPFSPIEEKTIIFMVDCESLLNKIGETTEKFKNYKKHFLIGVSPVIAKKSIAFFGSPVFRYTIEDAVNDGAIKRFKYHSIDLKIDDLFFTENYNDLKVSQEAYRFIAESIIKNAGNRDKAIVLTKDILEARQLSIMLNNLSTIEDFSRHLTSDQYKDSKTSTLQQFINNRKPNILVGVDRLLMTVHIPRLTKVFITKPIKSKTILEKIIGFISYADNPENVTVIDFTGNYSNFNTLLNGSDDSSNTSLSSQNYINKVPIIFRDKNNINGVLGVSVIAEEMAEIIQNMPYEQGRMIGIFGKWGRGKSFLMEEIWKQFSANSNFHKVDFHAWKYQDTPAFWAYLYNAFSEKYYQVGWMKWLQVLKLNFRREGFKLAVKNFFLLIVSALVTIGVTKLIDLSAQLVAVPILSVVILALFQKLNKEYKIQSDQTINYLTTKKDFRKTLGIQAEIQKELGYLFKAWFGKKSKHKVLLFVDDIDRCTEERIIQIIDALRVMLEDNLISQKVIVIAAIDESVLKRAIKLKYKHLVDLDNIPDESKAAHLEKLTKEYMDKLFLSGIKLGHLSNAEKEEFFTELTKNDIEVREKEPAQSASDTSNPNDISGGDIEDDEFNLENTSFEIDTDKKNNDSQEITNLKLSYEESLLLRNKLETYKEATPRQIRIFYFRYLLARNLLIKRHVSANKSFNWYDAGKQEVFISLLVYFSQHSNEKIVEEKTKTIRSDSPENITVPFLQNSKLSKEEYLEMLCVLELVVAY